MAIITYRNVGVTAAAACVPQRVSDNSSLEYLLSREDLEKTIRAIGIERKRIAESDVCASDLCFKAAKRLFEDTNVDPASIDLLLFLSQTPDHRIPATAPILQHRLGLPRTTAALDLSLGCSGYVYALSTAFSYASMEGVQKVLLLVGETFSKIINPRDKVNIPLYGDAGTATLIEKGHFDPSTFILYSDGAGEAAVKIKGGGFRYPITQQSCIEYEQEDGNVRNDLQVFMDGMDVFNFAIKEVPRSIKEIVERTGRPLTDIDFIVFHQANKLMTDFFIKKLKFPLEKVPYCLQDFGNTSSASIPLTLVSCLEGKLMEKKTLILCGFGAGLSWGTALLSFEKCIISRIFNY